MNQEIKAKWVAALRSGEYGQCTSVLNDGTGGFCCLGVLCDIKNSDGWVYQDEDDEVSVKFDGEMELPPHEVLDWAEFAQSELECNRIPVVSINGRAQQLHEHNDEGATFAQLADAIESQL